MKQKAMTDDRMCEIIDEAWSNYKGDCTVFMSAVGALAMGRIVGWQGVRVCMAASTFRKYEGILGIKFRDELPERTRESRRIRGIALVDGIGKFWQALSAGMVPALEGKMVKPAT